MRRLTKLDLQNMQSRTADRAHTNQRFRNALAVQPEHLLFYDSSGWFGSHRWFSSRASRDVDLFEGPYPAN